MSNYSPPFSITPAIASLLIEVGELVERWSMVAGGELSPQLRRNNRIKSIQASLAIEQNTLTIEQVTAIMDGERVLGLPRETLLGGVNGGISGGINLSDIETLVLSEMADSPRITLTTLAEKTGKSLRTIERVVKSLREKGIIERTGSNKSGSWLLVKGKRL